MFRIVESPIPLPPFDNVQSGAVVTFEGRVRDLNEGQRVVALEYDAYASLAEREGTAILEEAIARFWLHEASCHHRIGHLRLGDTAIWVRAVAGHRREAFDACRWILDEVKRRAPIWKKEHYADGASDWLMGESIGPSAEEYYDRQIRMPGFGPEAQQRLGRASVLVVGAGGLGCAALPYLVGVGVGRIVVMDEDRVAVDNLHRQVLFDIGQVGRPKAQAAADRLQRLNPLVRIDAIEDRLSPANARKFVDGFDLVLDGTDNFRTKFALNDACLAAGVPLVVACVHGSEGEIMLVAPSSPGGCLRCLWPNPPEDGCVGTCAEVGILGVVPGTLGLFQAAEAIKVLAGFGETLSTDLLLVDLGDFSTRRLARTRRATCPACGEGPPVDSWAVEWSERGDRILIDIRSPAEAIVEPFPEAGLAIPFDTFLDRLSEVPPGQGYGLVCSAGHRAEHLARTLHERGRTEFVALAGGLRAKPNRGQVSTFAPPERL